MSEINKVTIVAEHWDFETKTHYTTNWGADDKYFSRLCGVSDGLSLNPETLLLILNKAIVNYNIVAVLRLDNSHNQNQATINQYKKQCDYSAACKGFENVTHCDGEPKDLVLCDNHMQIYERLDLTQQLDDTIAFLTKKKQDLENQYSGLKDITNNLALKARMLQSQIDDMSNVVSASEYTIKLSNTIERYKKGKKLTEELESNNTELQAKNKALEEEIALKKRQLEQKTLELSEREKFIDKYYPMLKTLKTYNIDNKKLKELIYDYNLKIAKENI